MRPPLIWSDEAPGAVWAPSPLGSGRGPRSGLQGFRSESAAATQVMEFLAGAESGRGGGSLGRVCRTQKTSQDLDLALGLRSLGALGLFAALC